MDPSSKGLTPGAGEAISRSSSGSSTATVRAVERCALPQSSPRFTPFDEITPPTSRAGTPAPDLAPVSDLNLNEGWD